MIDEFYIYNIYDYIIIHIKKLNELEIYNINFIIINLFLNREYNYFF